ncbi:hypothetical protein CLIB1423_37S00298 [[Candida] railenensis]|uniref:Uncharacterized protein n=1 Tax=[Candida] railenensis TaxID=45579 RepID=A0A9P0QVP6_9ASCO|nr:hypothetical protein CLIB1423_37S00298 [[Candida] railenensis]
MSFVKVSNCGSYVSSVSALALDILDVYTNSPVHSFNIQSLVYNHFATHTDRRKASSYIKNMFVTQLSWEKLAPQSKSTKVGIVVESPNNFTLLMVLTLGTSTPIIIHQSALEGIHAFEWIDPIPNDEETAVSGSKQLVIFTKHKLIARVYSLECTHLLFELPKPVYTQILRRPSNPHFWSLLATSSSSHCSILYHFYNEGPKSQLLCKFQIQSLEGSDISWSKSGKWLLNFDCNNNLFGFQLQVYTSIGVFKRMYGDVKRRTVFKGDPILNINWLLDANDRNENFELGLLDYKAEWMRISNDANKENEKEQGDEEDECVLVVGNDSASINSSSIRIPILIASVKHLKIVARTEINLDGSTLVWTLFNQQYRKVTKISSAIRFGATASVLAIETAENTFVLLFDGVLLVCSLQSGTYEVSVDSIIELSSSINSVEFVENGSLLLISTSQDVSVYNVDSKSTQILYQPVTGAVQTVDYIGSEEIVIVTSDGDWVKVEEIRKLKAQPEALEPAARTLSIEKAEIESIKRLSPVKPILVQEQEKEETLSIAEGNTEATRLPKLGSRFKRGRLSLANDSRDDFTDTFNLKGPKRAR